MYAVPGAVTAAGYTTTGAQGVMVGYGAPPQGAGQYAVPGQAAPMAAGVGNSAQQQPQYAQVNARIFAGRFSF